MKDETDVYTVLSPLASEVQLLQSWTKVLGTLMM